MWGKYRGKILKRQSNEKEVTELCIKTLLRAMIIKDLVDSETYINLMYGFKEKRFNE